MSSTHGTNQFVLLDPLPPPKTKLFNHITTHTTDKETAAALDLLAQSYSAVKVAHAATSLGVAPDQAVAMATAQGWVHDASSAALAPPPKGSAAPESGEGVTLQQLADITLHLEK